MTLYNQAKQLLEAEYKSNFEIVKESEYHRVFANEKILHSKQVAGAGNGILKNEPYFQNKSAEFIDIAKTSILLHDIYRFREIVNMYNNGKHIDHSVEGYKFLSAIETFNSPLITIPIKHHGHMIEDFYTDDEWININDSELKKDIEHILFAVRDADKIANWHLMVNDVNTVKRLWAINNKTEDEQRFISENIWEFFKNEQIPPRENQKTTADNILNTIAWLFDINYNYSVVFCKRLRIFEKFDQMLRELGFEEEKIKEICLIVNNYITNRFSL